MKLCINCGHRFTASGWMCESCGHLPRKLAGFLAFAPELSVDNESYDPAVYDALVKLEERNFWFQARNKLILWAIRKYAADAGNYLEVGCGTGFVLTTVQKAFPQMEVSAGELHLQGLRHAAARVADGVDLFQMDARHIPYVEEFDLIGAFDVIEHVKEDTTVLRQMHGALRPGGHLLLTVPQHKFLWSRFDEAARHVRRYSKDELHGKVEAAGFSILRSTSFVFFLLPLMLLSRLPNRGKENFDRLDELRIGRLVNTALAGVMELEHAIIRLGMRLPMGGSRLLVARKRTAANASGSA